MVLNTYISDGQERKYKISTTVSRELSRARSEERRLPQKAESHSNKLETVYSEKDYPKTTTPMHKTAEHFKS